MVTQKALEDIVLRNLEDIPEGLRHDKFLVSNRYPIRTRVNYSYAIKELASIDKSHVSLIKVLKSISLAVGALPESAFFITKGM